MAHSVVNAGAVSYTAVRLRAREASRGPDQAAPRSCINAPDGCVDPVRSGSPEPNNWRQPLRCTPAAPMLITTTPADPGASLAELTDDQIDRLIAHPYWEPLGPELDALVDQLPHCSEQCERTTILTWIYQQGGTMSFLEISDRLTGYASTTTRKKYLRYMLRGLEKLLLVHIINFPSVQDAVCQQQGGVLGRCSVVSLTWSGMIWMRRAWQARATLARNGTLLLAHRNLVEEEDDGKACEPHWVENISAVDPEGAHRRAQRIAEIIPAIVSVFDLARRNRP